MRLSTPFFKFCFSRKRVFTQKSVFLRRFSAENFYVWFKTFLATCIEFLKFLNGICGDVPRIFAKWEGDAKNFFDFLRFRPLFRRTFSRLFVRTAPQESVFAPDGCGSALFPRLSAFAAFCPLFFFVRFAPRGEILCAALSAANRLFLKKASFAAAADSRYLPRFRYTYVYYLLFTCVRM